MHWMEENKTIHLRDLIDFRYDEKGGIPIDQVESVESIVKRFKTGAMSYSSISRKPRMKRWRLP
ncbi:MAG: glutamate synthase-related protein [Lachnospiraceae bacterium]